MKKVLFTLVALVAAILPASADRYLTFGENDTLRVNPSLEDSTQRVMVRAHFDGRLDQWEMIMQLPQGIRLVGYERCDDMLSLPYWNKSGERSYYSAPLFMYESDDGATVNLSSTISNSYGYWDFNNDGKFEIYGTIKWEEGDYERMCELVFKFEGHIADSVSIAISEHLSSTYDQRGFFIPDTRLNKTIHLIEFYKPGDVDGDGRVAIADVSALIDLLLGGDEASQGEDAQRAADLDGNGMVTIADLSDLIDKILSAS